MFRGISCEFVDRSDCTGKTRAIVTRIKHEQNTPDSREAVERQSPVFRLVGTRLILATETDIDEDVVGDAVPGVVNANKEEPKR